MSPAEYKPKPEPESGAENYDLLADYKVVA